MGKQGAITHEAGREQSRRLHVYVFRCVQLLHMPIVHHKDTVADGERLLLVVGDIDGGDPVEACMFRISSRRCLRSWASRADRGSSSNRSLGLTAKARASAIRCRSPPLRSMVFRF